MAGLPDDERPAGRLALAAAFASYQVDEDMVDAVRRGGADEDALVELTSWASMTAARRVGTWLA